jgi:predicted Zn-dependent protease with MMP-like domain
MTIDIFHLWQYLCSFDMQREKFEALVARAIDNLPPQFQRKLENVDIVVEEWPTPSQLREAKRRHPSQLLGLYQGVPQTRRGQRYGMILPDKIIIFQRPIEALCRFEEEVGARVEEVVRHEIAHHFGLDEETLRKIEWEKRRKR